MDRQFQSTPDRGGRFHRTLRRGILMNKRILLTSIALALALSGAKADWPMHRGGPQLQGVAQMAAPAEPKVAWTFNAGKPVKAAAAIAAGRVFFGDDAGVVHALELATGKE